MVRRSSKKNFIRTKCLGQDRLSSLPGHLLSRILSELPTKDSVRTSVLSKRWRNIWLDVPALDLNTYSFEKEIELIEFIDRFLEASNGLDRFKLDYDVTYEDSDDDFVSRIHDVLQQKVRHLTVVNWVEDALVGMPLSLYSCATLVDLTLCCVVFDDPESELVSLPCVKKMFLEGVMFDNDELLENLIASCMKLEDLTLMTYPDDNLEVMCVRSHSLKTFVLASRRPRFNDPKVEINAPKLEFMTIRHYEPRSFVIHSIGPLAKVDIDIVFAGGYEDPSKIIMLRNFLIGLSTVCEMTVSAGLLEVIHDYSEVDMLPQFPNLSRLNASLVKSSWVYLPAFLGCCMNLHSLILEIDYFPSIEEIELSPLPQCVLSSLEFVQLKTPGARRIKKLATYFMKNCAVFQNCTFKRMSGNIIKIIKKDSKEMKKV